MVHKSLSQETEDASDIDKVLSINGASHDTPTPAICKGNVNHTYRFAHKQSCPSQCQLVDRGANGGIAGSDMRILLKTGRKLNVVGIDNHQLTGLDVVTAAGLFQSSSGKVIGIFHEYAYLGKGSSIHSPSRNLSMIFPLVSCSSCASNNSSC